MKPAENRKIEIYSKKWCPYCRKAKAFLLSKGLSYIEYDIDEASKAEEMARRTDRKTVPQIFINDNHIGGYTDLLEAEKSGDLNRLLGISSEDYTNKAWELIVIGAGPAGLNAALYAARKGIDLLLISADLGGQVIDSDEIGNYIGKKDATGETLMYDFWDHLAQYKVKSVIGERVEEIIPGKEHIIRTDNGKEYKSKTIIIASGARKRRLGMRQEYVLTGKGVHYCAICDGFLYADKKVAVVGGGNSGLEAALDLSRLNCNVYLIEIQDQLMGDHYLQEQVRKNEKITVLTGTGIEEIRGQEKLESILVKNKLGETEELEVEGLFIEIGLEANSDFVSGILEVNSRKEIVINENNETNIPGIWAAGDVTDIKDKQIIISTAEGARAALRVNEYLKEVAG